MKNKIITEEAMGLTEVKSILQKVAKDEGELNFRAAKTLEYLKEFAKHSDKKAKELVKALEDLKISRLKPQHILKLVDTMPTIAQDVKVVMQGYALTITNESAQKIANALK